jgi:hypothetical protein
LFTCANPAMFPNMASTPRTDAEFASPQHAERAQGLMSSCVAPADPARSGFPASAVVQERATETTATSAFLSIVRIMSIRIVY